MAMTVIKGMMMDYYCVTYLYGKKKNIIIHRINIDIFKILSLKMATNQYLSPLFLNILIKDKNAQTFAES